MLLLLLLFADVVVADGVGADVVGAVSSISDRFLLDHKVVPGKLTIILSVLHPLGESLRVVL